MLKRVEVASWVLILCWSFQERVASLPPQQQVVLPPDLVEQQVLDEVEVGEEPHSNLRKHQI